jgi:hypothetical protein
MKQNMYVKLTKGQQLNKQYKLENIDEYCLTNFIAKSKLSEHHLQQCKLTNLAGNLFL